LEFKKGAKKYSDEEIDQLVDESVAAVRGEEQRTRTKARA
jgi:hypothetical protein